MRAIAQAAFGLSREQVRIRLQAITKLAGQAENNLNTDGPGAPFWDDIEAIEKLARELGMLTEIK